LNLLQAFLAQHSNSALATLQLQAQLPATIPQPQTHQAKVSKGVRNYPDGWQRVLNGAKDVVRSSILLKEPFPGPNQARITVNECFHEVFAAELTDGLILEPGMQVHVDNFTSH
jgi:hypothetical protein